MWVLQEAFSGVHWGRKGIEPDFTAAALLSAKALRALQLGAVTGKLCLLHNPNMNELDVTREPSWICGMGSSLAPYAVLTCISKKEQADSLCLLIIKGKGNVVCIEASLKSFWLKITFMIAD